MINSEPYKIFESWYEEAKKSEDSYPDGFTLATATSDGIPSARIVLLKRVLSEGFIFFTNYDSQKSEELLENPNAHMLFYWKSTLKQVRIRGVVSKASDEISNEYWSTREHTSNLNSALSKQSSEIEEGFNYQSAIKDFETQNPQSIERPENWGGFIISPKYFEFWENGDYRWHKRDVFSLNGNGDWDRKVLYP